VGRLGNRAYYRRAQVGTRAGFERGNQGVLECKFSCGEISLCYPRMIKNGLNRLVFEEIAAGKERPGNGSKV